MQSKAKENEVVALGDYKFCIPDFDPVNHIPIYPFEAESTAHDLTLKACLSTKISFDLQYDLPYVMKQNWIINAAVDSGLNGLPCSHARRISGAHFKYSYTKKHKNTVNPEK